MFLDVICEWCYLAKGILDSLRGRYDLDVTLLFMEIHPDAPEGGMPMSWHIPEPKKFFAMLNAMGAPYGVRFRDRDVFSNTRKALLAAEYAKSIGKGENFLRAIWRAYMEEGKNISEEAVIEEAAMTAGLGPPAPEGGGRWFGVRPQVVRRTGQPRRARLPESPRKLQGEVLRASGYNLAP
mgnify:CR=1 FL=1